MATYTEMAPIISGVGIGSSAVINYFENLPVPPAPPEDPEITVAKIVILADLYFAEESTGLTALARAASLNKSQVKAIINELQVLYGFWLSSEEPEVIAK